MCWRERGNWLKTGRNRTQRTGADWSVLGSREKLRKAAGVGSFAPFVGSLSVPR